MKSDWLSRIGGLALLAGAVIFVVHIVLRSVVTAGPDPAAVARAGSWIPINALGVLGAVLVILGLPALYPRTLVSGGSSGAIGLAMLAASWMLDGEFLSLYAALVQPWLADKAPSLVAAGAPPPAGFLVALMIGLVAWLVGAVLVAIPFVRRRAKPAWVGWVLMASPVWMMIGNLVIAPTGPSPDLALNLLSNMGPVLLLIPLGYLGYLLWAAAVLWGR